MKYKEILCYLDDGCAIRSNQCEYKMIDDVLHWRWIGEDSWTSVFTDEELENEWEIVV